MLNGVWLNEGGAINKKVSFRKVGHACFLAHCEGQSILFDPWFGSPVNFGTFHAYPAMIPPTDEELESLVAIHISHIHDDHCDLEALDRLPKQVPVVIGLYKNKEFRDRILRLGFSKVIELEPRPHGFKLGPFSLSVFPKAPFDGSFDSSAVLEADGVKFYIGNDCIHSLYQYYQLFEMFGPMDGGFLGHTILGPTLWCTDLSRCCDYLNAPKNSLGLARLIQAEAWQHVRDVSRILRFRWISPYASDIRFFNRDLRHHNDLFFPRSDLNEIAMDPTKRVFLNPGDLFEPGSSLADHASSEIDEVVPDQMVQPEWTAQNCPEVDLAELMVRARVYLRKIVQAQSFQWVCPYSIEFKVSDGSRAESVRFKYDGKLILEPGEWSSEGPDLVVEYPARALSELIRGRWDWRMFHGLYLHKIQVLRIKFGQGAVSRWG